MFSRFLFWLFNCHFMKNRNPNTVRFSFFIFTNELKNKLLKKSEINFMFVFLSMTYTLFKNKVVSSPLRFSAVKWLGGH